MRWPLAKGSQSPLWMPGLVLVLGLAAYMRLNQPELVEFKWDEANERRRPPAGEGASPLWL